MAAASGTAAVEATGIGCGSNGVSLGGAVVVEPVPAGGRLLPFVAAGAGLLEIFSLLVSIPSLLMSLSNNVSVAWSSVTENSSVGAGCVATGSEIAKGFVVKS